MAIECARMLLIAVMGIGFAVFTTELISMEVRWRRGPSDYLRAAWAEEWFYEHMKDFGFPPGWDRFVGL